MADASVGRIPHQKTIGREERSVTVVDEWTLLLRFPYDKSDNAALKKVTRGRARWDGRRKGYTLVIGATGLPPDVCALVEKLAAKHVLSVTREVRLLLGGIQPGRITPEMLAEPRPEQLRPMPPPPPPSPPPRTIDQLLQVTGAIYWTSGYFCAMCDTDVSWDSLALADGLPEGKPPRQRYVELRHILDYRMSKEEAQSVMEYLRSTPRWSRRRKSSPPIRLAGTPRKRRPTATAAPPARRRGWWFRLR